MHRRDAYSWPGGSCGRKFPTMSDGLVFKSVNVKDGPGRLLVCGVCMCACIASLTACGHHA